MSELDSKQESEEEESVEWCEDRRPGMFCGRLQNEPDVACVHLGNGHYFKLNKLADVNKDYIVALNSGQIEVLTDKGDQMERWVFNDVYWVCVPFKKSNTVCLLLTLGVSLCFFFSLVCISFKLVLQLLLILHLRS